MKKEIEAIIFMSDKSVPIDDLADFFNEDIEKIKDILKEIKEEKKDTGINLQIKNNLVSFMTNPLCGEAINKFFSPTVRVKKLSKSAMETLAIIAFKGPITKSEIEDIKGVSVDSSVMQLMEKKLIMSNERKKAIGNPKLYEVTENFYAYVGLEDKEELMNLDKAKWFMALDEIEGNENENK
ncbi:SMC-Scp complex subunit ScpB [Oceanivirga miroungae]|uniref:Chromosome segregation and condensation protein ScpB n=1 Tax=Oceanivirga miroungae TaxID=1130046 RepID=A0A6I8M9N6_9FUSO|nr:SMC-Scp complex subunit ScpB [Oceanivirga miroungae]VWL85528.1 chromosome segregation and condensation protein ScpB [Oceanivirga miroungae]